VETQLTKPGSMTACKMRWCGMTGFESRARRSAGVCSGYYLGSQKQGWEMMRMMRGRVWAGYIGVWDLIEQN
jgi:hypothetical protein